MDINHSSKARYERKYLTMEHSPEQLRNFLLMSSYVFKPIYYKRTVNSLYFDTPDLDYFQQNLNGDSQRKKVRIRWYGQDTLPDQMQIEVKMRDGDLIKKEAHQFEITGGKGTNQRLDSPVFLKNITLFVQDLLKGQLEEAMTLQPTLVNSYVREYFYSNHHQIRVTIDSDVKFWSLTDVETQRQARKMSFTILECKYDTENDTLLNGLVEQLPLRVSKSSKYVMGIQQSVPFVNAEP